MNRRLLFINVLLLIIIPLTAKAANKTCHVLYGLGNVFISQIESSTLTYCPPSLNFIFSIPPITVSSTDRVLPPDPLDAPLLFGLNNNLSIIEGGALFFDKDVLLGGADSFGNLQTIVANQGLWDMTTDADVLKAYTNSFTSFANSAPSGVFRKSGGMGVTTVDIPFLNDGGIIDVQTGVIDFTNTNLSSIGASLGLPPSPAIFDDTQVTGAGEMRISTEALIGSINIENDTALTINGQVTWSESNSKIFGTLTNNGTTTLVSDHPFTNDPNIILEAGSAFTNYGTVTGNGRIAVDPGAIFDNRGIFAPGNSPGKITIDGAYSQSIDGQLILEIAGINSGEFDVLEVLGTATFDAGTDIVFQFIDGFAPSMGDSFDVLLANLFVGDLNLIDYIILGLDPGFDFNVDFTNGAFTMTALNDGVASVSSVPIPGTVWLFGTGLLGLVGMARRKKAA